MLASGTLGSLNPLGETFHLRPTDMNQGKPCRFQIFVLFFIVIADHRIGRFLGTSANRSGPKSIVFPEKMTDVFVDLALVISGEVQINVRDFVPLKSQKRFKGDVMPVLYHNRPADRAVLRR